MMAAQSAQTANDSSDQSKSADKTNWAEPDALQQIPGVVGVVKCATGLLVELKTDSGTIRLRAPASARVRILKPSGEMDTVAKCSDLPGRRVVAKFKLDDAKGDSAIVESFQLLDSGVDANSSPLAAPMIPSANTGTPNPAVKGLEGDEISAEGKVTDVTCNGNEILVKMTVLEGLLTLHGRDYARLSYDDDRVAFENRDFPACTGLKGHAASITYRVVGHRPYDGEMQSVEIEK